MHNASAMPTVTSTRKHVAFFAAALAVAAFDIGSLVYFHRASVDFIEAARVRSVPQYRLGEHLSWQGQSPGALSGWWTPIPEGTWSVGPSATLEIRLIDPPRDAALLLQVWATPFAGSARSTREVEVLANGTLVARWELERGGPRVHAARIPRASLSTDRLRLELRFPEAASPAELGVSDDYRRLGLLIRGWRIDAASP